jgi:hypothetical protein
MNYPKKPQDAVDILKNGIGRDFTPEEMERVDSFLDFWNN